MIPLSKHRLNVLLKLKKRKALGAAKCLPRKNLVDVEPHALNMLEMFLSRTGRVNRKLKIEFDLLTDG